MVILLSDYYLTLSPENLDSIRNFEDWGLTLVAYEKNKCKLYLDITNVIHANECTKYANCDLHVNFWIFLLMPISFMMKKDHFK